MRSECLLSAAAADCLDLGVQLPADQTWKKMDVATPKRTQSDDRVSKERAMRRRQLKWLWKRLRQIATMEISREELLMKLGGARSKAPAAWRLVDVEIDKERPNFTFALNRKKLRTARRREGRYLLPARDRPPQASPAPAAAAQDHHRRREPGPPP